MSFVRSCLLAAISMGTRSLQAKDPINDFCRRWSHQTALVDGKLFVDGGLVAWSPLSTNPSNHTNTWLLYSDLNSSSQDVGMPFQYANLTKNESVPNVSGGILWADEVNKCFYLFGGQYQSNPSDFSFWTYDVPLNQWNETSYKSNVNSLQRVAFGAGATAPELGFGYYYGGWMNNQTNPQWSGLPMAASTLVQYDFSKGTLNNNSGPDVVGRAEGQMVYLPASDSGLLVYFGGIEDYHNGTTIAANMTTIHIFDIASSKWYRQRASGRIPQPRRQFCAGITFADDYSSYNIYLYGGFSADNLAGYDDVYVLSIPSFTWIKLYPSDNNADIQAYPHGGCTANVINKDQMIVMGGWFTASDQCDSPGSQGQHNMNLGYDGPASVLWDKYHPTITKYSVPTPVLSIIGGGPTGGATTKKPATWDNADLELYFTRVPTFAARVATRTVPTGAIGSSHSSDSTTKTKAGAIAGGVLGGLAGVIILLSSFLFCLRTRRNSLKKKRVTQTPAAPAELQDTSTIQELPSDGFDKYSIHQSGISQHLPSSGPTSPHSRFPIGGFQTHTPSYDAPLHSYHSPATVVAELPIDLNSGGNSCQPYTDNPSAIQVPSTPYTPHSDNENQRQYLNSTSQLSVYHSLHHNDLPQNPSPPPAATQTYQVYYPPPPDPLMHSPHIAYPDNHNGSPEESLYHQRTHNEYMSPPSTTTTPAHFYSPQYIHMHTQGNNRKMLADTDRDRTYSFGPESLSNSVQEESYRESSMNGSVNSQQRLGKGRFAEQDYI